MYLSDFIIVLRHALYIVLRPFLACFPPLKKTYLLTEVIVLYLTVPNFKLLNQINRTCET